MNVTETNPSWLDKAAQALVKDIVTVLSERRPDLLAVILSGAVAQHEERSLEAPILVMLTCWPLLTVTTHTLLFIKEVLSFLLSAWRITVT